MNAARRFLASGMFLAVTSSFAVVDPPGFRVSTAFGVGADAELREHNNNGVSSGSAGDLNTRTSSNGDRNEIIALRFDLNEHTLSNLAEVALNVVNFRNNSARQVALYGVKQGTMGGTGVYSTEDWDEIALTAFGDMPGLTVTDGDFTTQNLNAEQLTFLGQITFANLTKGTVETFSDPALTAFIRSYTGSKSVTFLLAAAPGYTSTGQGRIASKEAIALEAGDPAGNAGDFAPYLTFRTGGGSIPPSVLITSPINGADVDSGTAINIAVNATDDGTITKVEFFAGTEEPYALVGQDAAAPYNFSFTPPAAGTYTIRAVATDNQGLLGEHSVTVDVGVAIPPTMAITSPAEGAVLLRGSSIVIAATATDDVSVAKAEFFAGTAEPLALLGEDTTAPYTFPFTPVAAGTYTLRVVGTDNRGLTNSASVSVTVQEPAANFRTVSTAFGQGADGQVNEHTDSISGLGSDLNTRTSMNGDRNELVVLRFDLSEYTLADLSEVTLNIVNFRNNSARQVALYGVRQGVKGATEMYTTEDWQEIGLGFGDIPGLLATDGDFTTQSIDESKVTSLGQITFANLTKGTTETFNDPTLTDFVRSYAGSKLVTFLLAAAPGYTSTGQARFASREATALEGDPPGEEAGKFAPHLSFKTGGTAPPLRISSIARNGNQLTLQWSGGAGPFTVQRRPDLGAGAWTNVATGVNGTSATINLEGATGFLRVQGQ
jgi:hypothetical protein